MCQVRQNVTHRSSSGTIWHKRGGVVPSKVRCRVRAECDGIPQRLRREPRLHLRVTPSGDLGCKFLTPKCVRSTQESSGFILHSLGSEEIPHRHWLCFNGGNRSGFVMCIETRSVPARACVAILLNHSLPPDNRAGGFWSGVRGTCSHN